MSQSATPATRTEATTRLKPPKMTTSAELPIGTAIWSSYGRLRTVADGCGRLRTVANGSATSSEHTLNPQTPRVKREPLLRIREKSLAAIKKMNVLTATSDWRILPPQAKYEPLAARPAEETICGCRLCTTAWFTKAGPPPKKWGKPTRHI